MPYLFQHPRTPKQLKAINVERVEERKRGQEKGEGDEEEGQYSLHYNGQDFSGILRSNTEDKYLILVRKTQKSSNPATPTPKSSIPATKPKKSRQFFKVSQITGVIDVAPKIIHEDEEIDINKQNGQQNGLLGDEDSEDAMDKYEKMEIEYKKKQRQTMRAIRSGKNAPKKGKKGNSGKRDLEEKLERLSQARRGQRAKKRGQKKQLSAVQVARQMFKNKERKGDEKRKKKGGLGQN